MNKSDSERTRTVIERMGFTWTDREDEANMLGVLACSVRQKSIDKVYSRISKWNRWKKDKSLLTFVSGCMLPSDKEKFLKLFDLVFTMDELPELDAMVRQYGIVTPASLSPPAETSHSPVPGPKEVLTGRSMMENSRPDFLQVLRDHKIQKRSGSSGRSHHIIHRDLRPISPFRTAATSFAPSVLSHIHAAAKSQGPPLRS
jgi:hypothetical protein